MPACTNACRPRYLRRAAAGGRVSPLGRIFLLFLLLATVAAVWFGWRNVDSRRQPVVAAAPVIDKQPPVFANRTFDPLMPPADMPPMSFGEEAVCDSRFLSNAKVSGISRQADPTHATVTITRVAVTLQLNVTIWAPSSATPHVLEHEEGHRRISEYYYQTADQVAARIAATYLGRQVDVSGADVNAESGNMLQKTATDITEGYNKELNPEPAQQLYDTITDHSRNQVDANDAVTTALKTARSLSPPSPRPIQ